MKRLSMRPLRLTALLKVLNEIVIHGMRRKYVTVENVRKEVGMSSARMKEVLTELTRLELINIEQISGNEVTRSTSTGKKLITYWEVGNSNGMHEILSQKSEPYKYVITVLREHGPIEGKDLRKIVESIKEILESELGIIMTTWAVEYCLQWGDFLEKIQFFIGYGNREIAYYVLDQGVYLSDFEKSINKNYKELSEKRGDNIVELNKLREVVCFELKISREYFRNNLELFYKDNPREVYLFSAPPSLDIGGEFRKKIKTLSKRKVLYKDYQEGIDVCKINRKFIRISGGVVRC